MIRRGPNTHPIHRSPGAPDRLAYASGMYATVNVALGSDFTIATNILYGLPFHLDRDQEFDRIGIKVETAGGIGEKAVLGIYEMWTDGTPGELRLDAGTVDIDVAVIKEITISKVLSPGWYFFALNAATAATPKIASLNLAQYNGPLGTLAIGAASATYLERSHTYDGTLPDPFGGGLTYRAGDGPWIGLRAA